MPTIVDLFSGCGGFGLGAKLAGFDVVVAVDIDPDLQSAYARNFPNTRVVNGDLSKLDQKDWECLLGGATIDGVIGGPPCQGYSRMGKGDMLDPRRSLLRHFFRTVNLISPKFFVMENVEGLLDDKNMPELLDAIKTVDSKYVVLPPIVVDASKFGAPTKRKRVVVIGFDPTKMAEVKTHEILGIEMEETTVRDAIFDLAEPIAQSKDPENYGWSRYKPVRNLSAYAIKMRATPPINLGWPVALEKLQQKLVSGCFETIHTPNVMARYASTLPGSCDPVSRSKRLKWDGLCPTLRAGTGADKGSHQAVRPLHPKSARVITVREAARLQGFPDWFCFHQTKWHSFRMIGNSVSPLLAEGILKVIIEKTNVSKFGVALAA